MKNLENFIDMHRNEFDVFQPGPEVWAGITTGLTASVPLAKPFKWFGAGSKKLLLAFTVTSAVLGTGIWAYRSFKPSGTAMPVTSPASVQQAPVPAKVQDEIPVLQRTQQAAPLGREKRAEPDRSSLPAPAAKPEAPQPVINDVPVAAVDESTYRGIEALTLKSFGYHFRIRRSDSKMTRVRILKQGKVIDKETGAELVLKIVPSGSELVFRYEGEDEKREWQTNTVTTGLIEVLIPDGEVGRISAVSSNIDLDGYTAPALDVRTVSGNVNASAIKAKLSISSASGNQYLDRISGDLKCSAVSGDVNLKEMRGNTNIRTSSGKIDLVHVQGDLTCESTSGHIRLETIEGKLDLHTSSGNIGGESVTVVERCSIQTISGNIALGLQNNTSDLSFDLSSVSGLLEIKKGEILVKEKKSLRTGSGKIPLTAKTISGNQLYR